MRQLISSLWFLSCLALRTVVTDVYKLDLKGITVLGKLEAGSGLPFGLPFQPKLWKYAHETVIRFESRKCAKSIADHWSDLPLFSFRLLQLSRSCESEHQVSYHKQSKLTRFGPCSGYVDSVMAAKENSAKFGYPISANRELVALGMSADCEASKPLS
jgi:hypothetical protein